MLRRDKKPSYAWGLLAFLPYAYLAYGPILANPGLFEEDVVQHYLWLVPLRFDGALGQDVFTEVSGVIQPAGFWLLLRTLVVFFDPLTICRWGVLLPLGLTFLATYRLAGRHFPLLVALAAALVVCQSSFGLFQGMLARSFCIPLLLGAGLALDGKRPVVAQSVVLLLSALLYPPALLLNGTVFAGWHLFRGEPFRRPLSWLRGHWPLVAAAAAGLLVSWFHLRGVEAHPNLGAFQSREALLAGKEFGDGGRVNFRSLIDLPAVGWLRYYLPLSLPLFGAAWPAYLVILALPVVSWWDRRRSGRLSAWLLLLGLATVLLFLVAREVSPGLFLPERYVYYPWRMLFPLAATYCLAVPLTRSKVGGYLLAALLLAYGIYRLRTYEPYLYTTAYDRSVLAEIERLPADALIAGPFNALSQVPLLLHRPVLLSTEAAHALYFERYHDLITPRIEDQLAATLAPRDSLVRVVRFLDKYGVDYLLHAPLDYRKELFRSWAPYDRMFRDSVRARDSTDFALLQIPDSVGTFIEEGNFRLFDREELRRQLP